MKMKKKIFNTRLLSMLCFFIFMASISSCKKDEKGTTGNVELLSFGPAGVKHGEKISFIGKNLDKVTAVEMKGASIPKTAFEQQTSELIVLTVPMTTERGKITLKTTDGDIVSKAPIDFEVPFTITSMTGVARPGENITIKGTLLNWITAVGFADGVLDTNFVSKSLTEMVIKVPMNAQSGKLILYGAGTKPLTFESESMLTVTLPAITGLSPNPVKHAGNVTITGTNLDLATGVIFNGVPTAQKVFVSQSATQIVVKVPAGTTKGKLTLVAESLVKTQSTMDLDVALPNISALAPNPVKPETNLMITGTNLDLVTGISFTGIVAPVKIFVSQSATELVVKVPAGSLKGKLIFSVANSTLVVESGQVLDLIGGLPPLADFPYAIYTDDFQNGFQDWSWASRVTNSTANVRQGDKSIKATYGTGGYEGITFHNDAGVATGAYTKLEFSIFGEAGTSGKTMNVVINSGWGSPATVTLAEGEWKTFSLNISSIGAPNPLKEIVLQSAGWSGVVHIDHVGLR